ncbi:ATP-binding protein [Paraburkholderia monticola]|uniref:ATP-binding protein n=1 Tax=Paraburkholderia monticola TaxID=1399968 RepID=A0A149PXP1_9BURK|nr:SbcC/MukB-like Walker B domain-containing protein [Paraburkholderia monticola]KXU89825.1 ATP-binding protein [Paraburkholderia monticola]
MNIDQHVLLDGSDDQFRLARIQTFNWGTFSNVFDFPIPKEGYLFVGPSGSGKSTVLDAHAALLTPPKWLDFNVAAREADRHGRDRSAMTYIRGAWAQQTGDGGEYVSQYLRGGTTWSAIAETYRDEQGRVVVLAQVLWVKGNTTASSDAKRLYLTLEREFEIQELEFFVKNEFDTRRFKHDLLDAKVYTEFSAYQERFRRLLDIDNERALRLLHKTQSAKNLGDLNVFLRDFMLDEPETFGIATSLINEFGELNEAHQEVVAARDQIQMLKPARDAHMELERGNNDRIGLQAIQTAIDQYREHRRKVLVDERIAELEVDREASRQEFQRLSQIADDESVKLTDLQRQKLKIGADVLVRLEENIKATEADKLVRMNRRDQAATACKVMGWAMPDSVVWFVQRVESAKQRVLRAHDLTKEVEDRKDQLKADHRQASEEFTTVVAEVKALERQRSNLPARLVDLRERMARDLSIPEAKLPFAGELVEVRSDSTEWRGAIERVLGGFARSILVDEKLYPAVSAYLNERNIGERLVYFRIVQQTSGRMPGPNSLVRKLNFAQGSFGEWVREELKHSYDLECTDTLLAFRNAPRAVTREGLVKHNTVRHEKNDRHSVNDRSQWVLGFDNKDKLTLYKNKAAELGGRITELRVALDKIGDEEVLQQQQLLQCQNLSNLTWNDVDVGALLARIDDLTTRLNAERDARPDLAILDDRIKTQEGVHSTAIGKKNEEDAKGRSIKSDIEKLNVKLAELARLWPTSDRPPAFAAQIAARYVATGKEVTLENLDQVNGQVDRSLSNELRAIESHLGELRNAIVQRFVEFNRLWPSVAGGLDATLASADDYLAKLKRLEDDNLPAFEDRFFGLLREQSDQNLTLLATKLDEERSAIRSRMELVNESLETAPFNPGTHLVIETTDKSLEDVRLFRASLKESLSHSFSNDRDLAEDRFKTLAALVKRLASQETVDKNWRNLVLDVRQHVEFVARELDGDDVEVEVYRSGAGKSGGQRQKLAATCLAAALRYQLGGQDRALPSYSTVVLDEAFDKADAEFTAMAMNIFKAFGFQMIVATPLKSVMTLEPFIGGACFVHIKDRKKSAVIPIEYDSESHRLKLTQDVRNAEETTVS